MVDTWATVGSCAQIGKNVHLSGGVGIGGVLEPMQAGPTIIEDNCFIGARSEVVEGCIVREGSVLGMGVFIGQSTKIVDRDTGEVMYGEVPALRRRRGLHAVEERREPLLRRHRETGGRKDAVQDLDQRASARLDSCDGIVIGILGAVLGNFILTAVTGTSPPGLIGQLIVAVGGASLLIWIGRALFPRSLGPTEAPSQRLRSRPSLTETHEARLR
jgi:F0F1-type ATP synthase assembly protein I